jgi:hypothetical protein
MKGALLVPFAQDNRLYYIYQNKFVSRDLHPLLQGLQIFDTRSVRGKGLRVLENVACGSVVGDYGGVYRHGEVTSTNAYTFGVGDHGWVVDAEFHGNLLRYVNDPHGTGHAANVRAETVCYYARGISLMTVRFITTMDVAAGSEFFLDYGPLYFENLLSPAAEAHNVVVIRPKTVKEARSERCKLLMERVEELGCYAELEQALDALCKKRK